MAAKRKTPVAPSEPPVNSGDQAAAPKPFKLKEVLSEARTPMTLYWSESLRRESHPSAEPKSAENLFFSNGPFLWDTQTDEELREVVATFLENYGSTLDNRGFRFVASILRRGPNKRRGRPKDQERLFQIKARLFLTNPLPTRKQAIEEIQREWNLGPERAGALFARAWRLAGKPPLPRAKPGPKRKPG